MKKPGVEKIGDSQDNMAIGDPWEEAAADEVDPTVGIDFGAGEAERRFTSKSEYLQNVVRYIYNLKHAF